ncbi:MAG: GntR family transcriptional repressor for pyruvate dehydrogenase complex [Granulosicoccus sp.]|jgi:GntR family transcriptional repressor for pyruvate dehydrogenase complex|tara:strand:- start:8042 stop:8740 length:699 start_codon:yes stop_codon:yes gene_type:complete
MLWGMKPVEQQAAYGLAVDKIKQMIHLGLLLSGERMPAERKLAEQISISRVTLREALRILESEGYVTIRRGAAGGAFVVEEVQLREMAKCRISGDPAAAMRVFEYRIVAEPLAAKLAAIRRTPADLKRLENTLLEIGKASSSGELRRGETTFHLSIVQASANRFLLNSLEEALASLFLPLPNGELSPERAKSLMLRERVFEAIRDRLETEAEQRMKILVEVDQSRLPERNVA